MRAKNGKYLGNDITKGSRALLGARGACECLGLGILFLIPDIIASIINACRDKQKYDFTVESSDAEDGK